MFCYFEGEGGREEENQWRRWAVGALGFLLSWRKSSKNDMASYRHSPHVQNPPELGSRCFWFVLWVRGGCGMKGCCEGKRVRGDGGDGRDRVVVRKLKGE